MFPVTDCYTSQSISLAVVIQCKNHMALHCSNRKSWRASIPALPFPMFCRHKVTWGRAMPLSVSYEILTRCCCSQNPNFYSLHRLPDGTKIIQISPIFCRKQTKNTQTCETKFSERIHDLENSYRKNYTPIRSSLLSNEISKALYVTGKQWRLFTTRIIMLLWTMD